MSGTDRPEAHGARSPAGRRRNLNEQIATEIAALIAEERMPVGTHLPTNDLALRFKVSRWPVLQALKTLSGKGVVRYQRDRGFFVDHAPVESPAGSAVRNGEITRAYFQVAADRLDGRIGNHVSESFLRQRYGLTRAQLSELLNRIVQEGWAERRSGYGWTFTDVLITPEALRQTYEFRLIIEPAGLLQPGYRLPRAAIERTRAVEKELLAGGIEEASPDVLYARAVQFHETLMAGSGNPFMLDALRRVNRVRRLLMYRSMGDRARYYRQSEEHLHLLDLLEQERNGEAAEFMREHLSAVVGSLREIGIL